MKKHRKVVFKFSANFNSDEFAFKKEWDSFGGQDHRDYYKEPIYCFIDVETNGLPESNAKPETNPEDYPEIIQFASLYCDSTGKRYAGSNAYFLPKNWILKPEIRKLINLDELNEAYSLYSILDNEGNLLDEDSQWYFYFHHILATNDPLFGLQGRYKVEYVVGHNIDFDLNCIKAIYYRHKNWHENRTKHSNVAIFKADHFSSKYEERFLNGIAKLKKICTMKSTTEFCGLKNSKGYKYPKLEELYLKLFGESIGIKHDAKVNVFNTAKCYWKLRDIGEIN